LNLDTPLLKLKTWSTSSYNSNHFNYAIKLKLKLNGKQSLQETIIKTINKQNPKREKIKLRSIIYDTWIEFMIRWFFRWKHINRVSSFFLPCKNWRLTLRDYPCWRRQWKKSQGGMDLVWLSFFFLIQVKGLICFVYVGCCLIKTHFYRIIYYFCFQPGDYRFFYC
jgi:hypothetical protein